MTKKINNMITPKILNISSFFLINTQNTFLYLFSVWYPYYTSY